MANTFFDKVVDNRIVEETWRETMLRLKAERELADAQRKNRDHKYKTTMAHKVATRKQDFKEKQYADKQAASAKKDAAREKAEINKAKIQKKGELDKNVNKAAKAFKAAGKFKKEKTGYGDDSMKAGGVVAANLARGIGSAADKLGKLKKLRDAQDKAKKKPDDNDPPSSGGSGGPVKGYLPPKVKRPRVPYKPGESLGQRARRDPEAKKQMIKDRGGTVTEGLRTAVKNVIKKVKAYQKKRKSIVKRDPDATAVATTKGSKITKYEKQPSSVSKAGSSAVTSTAKKEVAQKKGKETEGQKARRDPEYRKKRIEQDVAAARKWVNRRKAVRAVQSVTQKAKDAASSAKEAGGKLVKSVSGKLSRQIRSGAYKAKQAATKTGKKVAKATLEKDPTAKLGARFRNWHHKQNTRSDRYLHYKRKGIKPLSGKGKPKSEDKPKSDGKVPDPWKEGFSNWRVEFLHEVEQPEMGETDQKEPDSKSKSKKGDTEEKKVDVMKGKNKVEVNPQLKAESINHPIDPEKHKKAQKVAKIRNLAKDNKNPNEKKAAEKKAGGPKLYGEDSVMIQDADGNDFLEVIDVIKAEPLVPVKEGKVNGNGRQEKFNRAMNAYRKAQRAGNLSNKERVDRLKDNAKIRREAEKKEKKGKQFAGGQVYNEETPDAISGKDLKRISALSGKKTRFGPEEKAKRKAALEKKRGMKLDDHPQFKEEKLDEISMRTARIAFDKAGKKADDAEKRGDKQTADIKSTQRANIGYMIRARERKLDKRKSDLERTLKKS